MKTIDFIDGLNKPYVLIRVGRTGPREYTEAYIGNQQEQNHVDLNKAMKRIEKGGMQLIKSIKANKAETDYIFT